MESTHGPAGVAAMISIMCKGMAGITVKHSACKVDWCRCGCHNKPAVCTHLTNGIVCPYGTACPDKEPMEPVTREVKDLLEQPAAKGRPAQCTNDVPCLLKICPHCRTLWGSVRYTQTCGPICAEAWEFCVEAKHCGHADCKIPGCLCTKCHGPAEPQGPVYYINKASGLLKCCIPAVRDHLQARRADGQPEPTEGYRFYCPKCRGGIVLDKNTFRWGTT